MNRKYSVVVNDPFTYIFKGNKYWCTIKCKWEVDPDPKDNRTVGPLPDTAIILLGLSL